MAFKFTKAEAVCGGPRGKADHHNCLGAVALIMICLAQALSLPPHGREGSAAQLASDGRLQEALRPDPAGGVSAEYVIARMLEANRLRGSELRAYTATRTYRAVNFRFRKKAEMQALLRFESPGTKRFTILSEEGSSAVRRLVFRGMMDAEVDVLTPTMMRRSAINTDNYRFRLVGEEEIRGYHSYVLEVEPTRKDKYLFRGRIWIEASDFALVEIRGSPAENPSFWTRSVEYVRDYQKIGDFWLPLKEEATSEIRIFGKSQVVVQHSNYQIEASAPLSGRAFDKKPLGDEKRF